MLTIVTGVPGGGKTLLTLERILNEFQVPKGQARRPVYVNGIPELNYEYFHADEMVDPDHWYNLPDGSILVFDEAQKVFPQRPPSIPVPEKCQQFSTHRHKGMDIFIITQNATNIDAFVRKMCGRHLHVHRILNREVATVYEYDHYEPDPTGWGPKREAISVIPWKYPKKLYNKYKSATMHTYKANTPWKLYALPVLAIGSIGLLVWAFGHLKERIQDMDPDASSSNTTEQTETGFLSTFSGASAPGNETALYSYNEYTKQFQNLILGLQHSQPFYQSEYVAVSYPIPHCVLFDNAEQCKCYTQQITTYETPEQNCRYWAVHGFFDPTKDELYAEARQGGQAHAPAAASRKRN